MKALAADADISKMLRDPKMQEIMSAVMTGGPQGLQKVSYFNSFRFFLFQNL